MAATCRILLVDDDPDIRDVLSTALHDEGYQVCCLANGAAALSLLRSAARPDVILLDLMMPEMDGWELRAELKAHPELRKIPVIYLSGAYGAAERLRAEDRALFLVKPFEFANLLSILRGSLQGANED
jgi:adenylate cyclase